MGKRVARPTPAARRAEVSAALATKRQGGNTAPARGQHRASAPTTGK